jgi:hypothetical protein
MPEHSTNSTGFMFRFFSPGQIDEILRNGAKLGREGSSAAISRILKVEPAIERSDLWRRLRQLRFAARDKPYQKSVWTAQDDQLLTRGYENGWTGKRAAIRKLLRFHPDWRPHTIWKRAARLGLVQKTAKHGRERCSCRWNHREDQILLNLAGYKSCRVIAKVLHRSEAAIRCRLILHGKSSRAYRDGFSRQELAGQLHMGKNTIQRLIVDGFLQIRDPRITRESLKAFCESGALSPAGDHQMRTTSADSVRPISTDRPLGSEASAGIGKSSRAERVWAEAGRSLGVPLSTIKSLLVRRVLKLYDPTITETSVRNFCKNYGSMIDYESLNRETQEWLERSMDLQRGAGESAARRFNPLREHARVRRWCPNCGQSFRGNVFFRHVKECRSRT